tara:strand:- start:7 stop:174 length:168 start_codon:yes stop_codon:yes gene_type:complete
MTQQLQLKITEETMQSVKRDRDLANLIQGNMDNIELMAKRIVKLEEAVRRLNEKQ